MEVKAVHVFDAPLLKIGSRLHMAYRHPFFVAMRYVYLLLVPLGIYLLAKGDHKFGFVFMMCGGFLFARKYFWQYRLMQNAAASPQSGHKITTVFRENGIHQKSELHDTELKWESFSDRYLSAEAFLLYPQKHCYLIFSRDGFASQQDYEQVSKWAGEKIRVIHP